MTLKTLIESLTNRLGSLQFTKRTLARKVYPERFSYQQEYISFDINEGETVLDLGSGNHPFPLATHLSDFYLDDNFHRGGQRLEQDSRPFFHVNIESLPFRDKEFDFIYCSHVLEHLHDPHKACDEIMRVGKRGYIETPTRASDMLFNFSRLHRWHVSLAANTLIFIEYSQREKEGTGTSCFEEQYRNPYNNEVKKMIMGNRDIFCNMLLWKDTFHYYVFDRNGTLLHDSKTR